MRLLIEAFIVGMTLVITGNVIGFIVRKLFTTQLSPSCKDWNKNYVMEITLFLSGALIHLFFEFTGVNRWYCKNGNACRKK